MLVTPFLLSHSNPGLSTAFLVKHQESYILYLGDTGADAIEKSENLLKLWTVAAPLVESKKLKAIFIEVSFSNDQPSHLLFGHLTPGLLMEEMKVLDRLSNGHLKNLPVVVTHMKPSVDREQMIKRQLKELNTLDLKLIFPQQGRPIKF